jgi:hypothetical protein
MAISLFRSTKKPDMFGFTSDPTGSNLPIEFGPWRSAGAATAVQTNADGNLEGFASSDPVLKAVERDGYFLGRSGITISAGPDRDVIH